MQPTHCPPHLIPPGPRTAVSVLKDSQAPTDFGRALEVDHMYNGTLCPACFVALSIHDRPRFLETLPQGQQCHDVGVLAQAHVAILLASHGLPIIYYGDEQAFAGRCTNYNREVNIPLNKGLYELEQIETCKTLVEEHDDTYFRQDMWIKGVFKLDAAVPIGH